MKLENQVCGLDLAKRLKELGVKQESLFWWVDAYENYKITSEAYNEDWVVRSEKNGFSNISDDKKCSAFTVAELGEMLPENVCWRDYRKGYGKWGFNWGDFRAEADTEANARAKMLVYLLENKLIKL